MPKKVGEGSGKMEAQRSPLFKGYRKVLVSLRPEQAERLRVEARARADRAGQFRPDASEVIREALDAWFAKRK